MAGGSPLNRSNYKILQRCGLDDIFIFLRPRTTASPQGSRCGPTPSWRRGPSVRRFGWPHWVRRLRRRSWTPPSRPTPTCWSSKRSRPRRWWRRSPATVRRQHRRPIRRGASRATCVGSSLHPGRPHLRADEGRHQRAGEVPRISPLRAGDSTGLQSEVFALGTRAPSCCWWQTTSS